jgi:hypothetical protein
MTFVTNIEHMVHYGRNLWGEAADTFREGMKLLDTLKTFREGMKLLVCNNRV